MSNGCAYPQSITVSTQNMRGLANFLYVCHLQFNIQFNLCVGKKMQHITYTKKSVQNPKRTRLGATLMMSRCAPFFCLAILVLHHT